VPTTVGTVLELGRGQDVLPEPEDPVGLTLHWPQVPVAGTVAPLELRPLDRRVARAVGGSGPVG
jgi:hypothetical protein